MVNPPEHAPVFNSILPDSLTADTLTFYKQKILQAAYTNGYLNATIRIQETKDSAFFILKTEEQFAFGKIDWRLPEGFVFPSLQNASLHKKNLTPKEWSTFVNTYLNYYENNGYPFVNIQVKNVEIISDTLYAQAYLNPGKKITVDSVAILGYNNFSANVLKYDLGFFPGMLYRENYLSELQQRIQQIEYLSFSRNPGIAFFTNKTTLYLYTKEVPGNQINGVVGINTKENGEVTFNGDFELRLLNAFKGGEDINLRWRRPDDAQQFLNLSLTLPYLFKTPIWVTGALEILRQDSSFVNTELQADLKYLLSGRNFLVGGLTYTGSNTLQNENISAAYNSFNSYKYRLGAEINQSNRILIPNKGYILNIAPFSGTRATADTSTRQFGWDISTSLFTHIKGGHHLLNRLQSQSLFGIGLYENELYRIGGLKSMRGFNEQSLYTSLYGIYTLEYRYFFGEYDYLAVFGDFAYTEKKTVIENNQNWLTGTGAGINFYTKGGIFSMFFAVGKTQSTPFDFRAVKVHFGYINRF